MRASRGVWSTLASLSPLWPSSTGGMYHGDLTDKLKVLYKLHLPPGESLPCRSPMRGSHLSRTTAVASRAQHNGGSPVPCTRAETQPILV